LKSRDGRLPCRSKDGGQSHSEALEDASTAVLWRSRPMEGLVGFAMMILIKTGSEFFLLR
jgi:hypothetical protein